jgi:hypothetical protein
LFYAPRFIGLFSVSLTKFNKIVEVMNMHEHLTKNHNGRYLFTESRASRIKLYAYMWGRYHDPLYIDLEGTGKDANEAIVGSKTFLALNPPNGTKKTNAQNRIIALGGLL